MSAIPTSLFIGLIALFGATSQAATLQQLSVDQLAAGATAIVRATVVGSSASFTGNTIYTHYKLKISETWKGFATPEVMVPGGISGKYRQTFPGVPELQVGSEYVLFLWTSSTGITHLEGLTQGMFHVATQANGTVLLSRPGGADTMLDATGHLVVDRPLSIAIGDLKTRVGQTAWRGQAQ